MIAVLDLATAKVFALTPDVLSDAATPKQQLHVQQQRWRSLLGDDRSPAGKARRQPDIRRLAIH